MILRAFYLRQLHGNINTYSKYWKEDLKVKSHKLKRSEMFQGYLLLAPALIVILCFTIIPIVQAFYTSFHETKYAVVGGFVGLKNYVSVLGTSIGWINILNSVEYVVFSLLLAIPIGVGIGTLLKRKSHGITIVRTLIRIPWVRSQTVTALLWKWLGNGNYGLVT